MLLPLLRLPHTTGANQCQLDDIWFTCASYTSWWAIFFGRGSHLSCSHHKQLSFRKGSLLCSGERPISNGATWRNEATLGASLLFIKLCCAMRDFFWNKLLFFIVKVLTYNAYFVIISVWFFKSKDLFKTPYQDVRGTRTSTTQWLMC